MKQKFYLTIFSLLLVTTVFSQTQQGTIQGTVVSESGDALADINILLEGTTLGAATDTNGNFKIDNVPFGDYMLVVSSVGYATKRERISIDQKKDIFVNIKLDITASNLSEVVIEGTSVQTSIAFRTDDPIQEIPLSIQSVSKTLFKLQGATSYTQVLRNFSGVIQNTPYQRFTHRGFVSSNNFLVNGMKTSTYVSFNQQPALFNIESIENLKGPASALFGDNEPGGVVNFNLKKPQFTKRFEADLFYGSWNTFGGMVDYSAPVNSKIAYRIVGGYESTNSFRKPREGNNYLINPSITFKLSNKSSLTADLTYQRQKMGYAYDRGIIAYRNADGTYNTDRHPLSWTATSKDDHTENDGYSVGLEYKNSISNKFEIGSLLRVSHVNTDNEGHEQFYGYPVSGTPDSVQRYYNDYQLSEKDINWTGFFNYKINTGKIRHTLSPGVDVRQYRSDNLYLEHDVVPSILFDNPDYSNDDPKSYSDSAYYENSKYNTFTYAFYLQEQMSIGDKWRISASVRYQNYKYIAKPGLMDVKNSIQSPDTSVAVAWLPRFGLVYVANKSISVYANYATSFLPQYSNYRFYGGPFDPEKGKQLEAGTKFSLNQNKLFGTISVFQIAKENILFTDPTDPSGNTFIQTGKARSRGIEVSLAGEISKSISISANYAYTKAIFSENSDAGEKGTSLPSAPENIGNVWLTYAAHQDTDNQLSISTGLQYVDKRLAINSPGFEVPSYFTMDAALQYRIRKITLKLNANNLFDKRYFYGAQSAARLFPGDPFNIRIGVNYLLAK